MTGAEKDNSKISSGPKTNDNIRHEKENTMTENKKMQNFPTFNAEVQNDVAKMNSQKTVNKHISPVNNGWGFSKTNTKDNSKMRTFTKNTHHFDEMQHKLPDRLAETIFFLVTGTITAALLFTAVYLVNTNIQ